MEMEIKAGLYSLICITGIPGTGKSTLCRMLNEHGFKCTGLNHIASSAGVNKEDIVDIDELSSIRIDSDIVESHYSHLLNCSYVIVLIDDNETLKKRMKERGYSIEKINENLDAQMADIIYYEALDRLPANRIHIINERSRNIGDIYNEVIHIISRINNSK